MRSNLATVGQRRRDREWPRPRHTRHVWVRSESTLVPPVQGYVLEWRRQSYRWSALVLYTRETPEASVEYVQQWLPAERLRPVKADPNERPWHY